ncbi:LuxR C-terminal-related transcriptional regulator [Pseudomaricurvus sp. HS19]|uniref:LuxR C-terminal-related transcriptional regulator n=1 Tax=Pseudomaricurvus sp. HS19 TaxID=2692626 RepID=UPI00136C7DB2|nr:LuxR C-terminal-related transcriptional regulator [Pseudomaricurvus sp. HS19]MYM64620.1 hypothetical protein [Pseudomaricurvus sp. HS19]
MTHLTYPSALPSTQPEKEPLLHLPILLFSPARSIDNILLSREIQARLECGSDITAALPLTDSALVLIDCREVSAANIQFWFNQLSADGHKAPPCALINCSRNSDHERLIEWPQLRGIFSRNTAGTLFYQGLQHIREGDLWFCRRLCQDFLRRRRYAPSHNVLHNPGLHFTQREQQMLHGIYAGLTNGAIAIQMGLSEHTVKSHMYNLFRKIGVKSRLEVSNWLRDCYPFITRRQSCSDG